MTGQQVFMLEQLDLVAIDHALPTALSGILVIIRLKV